MSAHPFLDGVVVGVEGVGFECVEVLVDLRGDGGEFRFHGLEFGGHRVVAGFVDLAGGADGVADELVLVAVEAGDGVEYGLVEGVCVDAVLVAGVCAVLHALHARVVAVGLGLAGGAGADHRAAALGAGQAAGNHVVGAVRGAARMAVAARVHDAFGFVELLGGDDPGVRVQFDDVAVVDLSEVDAVLQDGENPFEGPESAASGAVSAFVQLVGDGPGAETVLCVQVEHQPDHGGLGLDHDELVGDRVHHVAGRGVAALPLSGLGLLLHARRDAVHDQVPLELREHRQQLKHHPADRGRGVERLGGGPERHADALQLVQQRHGVTQVAGEPVHSIHEQHVNHVRPCPLHRLFQAGPVGVLSGRVIAELLDDLPARLRLDVGLQPGVLRLQRVGLVLVVGAAPRVDPDPHGVEVKLRRSGAYLLGPRPPRQNKSPN
nr:hypothetical protein [Lentzea albidocapillata]